MTFIIIERYTIVQNGDAVERCDTCTAICENYSQAANIVVGRLAELPTGAEVSIKQLGTAPVPATPNLCVYCAHFDTYEDAFPCNRSQGIGCGSSSSYWEAEKK